MKKTIYVVNTEQNYNYILNKLINEQKLEHFTIKETNYTKTILSEYANFIFNETGKRDNNMLQLISKVKSNAKKYLKNNNVTNLNSVAVNWYYFNDFATYNKRFEGYQLDLNSAYWETALQMGILNKETYTTWEQFTKHLSKKEKKKMRLKALGSLATKKVVTEYKNGEFILVGVDYDIELRNLYINICNKVATIMKSIQDYVNLPYYYWDMFVIQNNEQLKAVENELKKHNLKYKLNTDVFEVVKGNYINYIYSHLKNYNYPIKKEHIL